MFDLSLIPNLIGGAALAANTGVMLRKSEDKILVVASVASLLWSLHYFLIGTLVGGFTSLEAAFFIYAAHRMMANGTANAWRVLACLANIAIALAVAVAYMKTRWALTAPMSVSIFSISEFFLTGPSLRYGFILGRAVNAIFALAVGSLPRFLQSLITVSAGVVGGWRSYRARRIEPTLAAP